MVIRRPASSSVLYFSLAQILLFSLCCTTRAAKNVANSTADAVLIPANAAAAAKPSEKVVLSAAKAKPAEASIAAGVSPAVVSAIPVVLTGAVPAAVVAAASNSTKKDKKSSSSSSLDMDDDLDKEEALIIAAAEKRQREKFEEDGKMFDTWYAQRDRDEFAKLKKRAAVADDCQKQNKQLDHELREFRSDRDELINDKEKLKSKLKECKLLVKALERSLAALEESHRRDMRVAQLESDEWKDRALKTRALVHRWN